MMELMMMKMKKNVCVCVATLSRLCVIGQDCSTLPQILRYPPGAELPVKSVVSLFGAWRTFFRSIYNGSLFFSAGCFFHNLLPSTFCKILHLGYLLKGFSFNSGVNMAAVASLCKHDHFSILHTWGYEWDFQTPGSLWCLFQSSGWRRSFQVKWLRFYLWASSFKL